MVGDDLGEVLKQMRVAASAMVAAKTAVLEAADGSVEPPLAASMTTLACRSTSSVTVTR